MRKATNRCSAVRDTPMCCLEDARSLSGRLFRYWKWEDEDQVEFIEERVAVHTETGDRSPW